MERGEHGTGLECSGRESEGMGVGGQRDVTSDLCFREIANWDCVKVGLLPTFHHEETPFINLPP